MLNHWRYMWTCKSLKMLNGTAERMSKKHTFAEYEKAQRNSRSMEYAIVFRKSRTTLLTSVWKVRTLLQCSFQGPLPLLTTSYHHGLLKEHQRCPAPSPIYEPVWGNFNFKKQLISI